jgi:hypothetical protein
MTWHEISSRRLNATVARPTCICPYDTLGEMKLKLLLAPFVGRIATVTRIRELGSVRVWTDHYGPAHAARAFYLPPEVAAEWLTSTGGSNESNSRAKKRGSGFKAAFG